MIYLIITAGILALDLAVKAYIEKTKKPGDTQEILGGKVILQKVYNRGLCLNLLDKKRNIVVGLSAGCTLAVLLFYIGLLFQKGYHGLKLALSFLAGGALSNLYDRLVRKYVVDYFSFQVKWKRLSKVVFNLADLFIFLGSALAVIATMCRRKA